MNTHSCFGSLWVFCLLVLVIVGSIVIISVWVILAHFDNIVPRFNNYGQIINHNSAKGPQV